MKRDQSWLGKDVFSLMRFGGYSDVVIVPEKQAFEKPASVSHDQAAAIPVNYLTAWQLLVVMGSLKPGEMVLIHNAGGGVGLAAIDVARHIGARSWDAHPQKSVPIRVPRGRARAVAFAG